MSRGIWTAFTEIEPEDTGEALLIVWNKGADRQLAVAWKGVENFRSEHNVGNGDKLLFWMYLPDPEAA